MSIPVVAYATYWNLKKARNNMEEANVLEYHRKRSKFDHDAYLVEKVLKNRVNLIKEKEN